MVSTNATDLLKYLIRRTDITLLISNIRLALSTGRINPILRDTIEYLLDYTLGLVKCIWDVEDLPSGPTRVLQWLILSYGGTQTWNRFAQIVQRDVRMATRMVENIQVDPPYPIGLERLINDLQIYSNMLIGSIQYDRNGGPALNGEEYELRGTREHLQRNIPTTNQERVAFRVERALRELRTKRNNLEAIDYSIRAGGWDGELQPQAGAGVEAGNDGLAPGYAHHVGHQDDVGLGIAQGISNETVIGLRPLSSNEASKENFSNHLDSSNSLKNIREDIIELSEALHKALKLQEKLIRQFRNNEDGLEAHIQPENSTQEPKRQNNSNPPKGKAPDGRPEVKPRVEYKTSMGEGMGEAEEMENNDKSKPALSIDTKVSMPATGGGSPTGSYVLFTPPTECPPSEWCSNLFTS